MKCTLGSLFTIISFFLGLVVSFEAQSFKVNTSANHSAEFHLFLDFMREFGVTYKSEVEKANRFEVFRSNLKLAEKLNEQETGTAEYGVTKFSDLTQEEFQEFLSLRAPGIGILSRKTPTNLDTGEGERPRKSPPPFSAKALRRKRSGSPSPSGSRSPSPDSKSTIKGPRPPEINTSPGASSSSKAPGTPSTLPLYISSPRYHTPRKTPRTPASPKPPSPIRPSKKFFTWESRTSPPVKAQGKCGACWALTVASAVGMHYGKIMNQRVSLSEQQLLDCANAGDCTDGTLDKALDYVRDYPLQLAADYPYEERDKQQCRYDATKAKAKITEWWSFDSEEDALNQIQNSPIITAICGDKLQQYKAGVMDHNGCKHTEEDLNHAVLIIGYANGLFKDKSGRSIDTWHVQNTWGPDWGMKGTFSIQRNVHACGIGRINIILQAKKSDFKP